MELALGSRGAGFHKRGTRPRPGAGSLKISALHHPHPEQGLSTGGQGLWMESISHHLHRRRRPRPGGRETGPPPRTPHYNVEAKWGSCQMESISHHRRCNFSPSTLDSGWAGGGALTPRCAKTPDHTPPSPEVVRNTFHLPSRCALSSLPSVHFRHNPWSRPSRRGFFEKPCSSPLRRVT